MITGMKEIYMKKYLFLFVGIILSFTFLWFSSEESIIIHILSFLILSLFAVSVVNFNLFHPYVWFSIFFSLYSLSYPILYAFGYISKFGYSKELVLLQWLALVIFLLVVTPNNYEKNNLIIQPKNMLFNKISINVFSISLVVSTLIIALKGYTHKNEIYSSGNIFLILSFRLALLLIIIFMYELIYDLVRKGKINKYLFLKTFCSIILFTLYTGERDLFFRLIIIYGLILYRYSKINNKVILILAPIGILALPLSHMYKYYFLTKSVSSAIQINFRTIFFEFLDGEFISASRNLQILLNDSDYTKGLFHGKTIINDFIRVFFNTEFTHGEWYHNQFFSEVMTTRYGFTLVGQGYINFGYVGVVLIFTMLGIFIKYLYKNSNNSIYGLMIYVYSVPLVIYSIRADLGNIMSPFVNHLLMSIGALILLEKIFDKLQRKQ